MTAPDVAGEEGGRLGRWEVGGEVEFWVSEKQGEVELVGVHS